MSEVEVAQATAIHDRLGWPLAEKRTLAERARSELEIGPGCWMCDLAIVAVPGLTMVQLNRIPTPQIAVEISAAR